jgi:TolB-like protein
MDRKLAAILAADVVGYSRLMAENEADTFDRLRAHRKELFEPEIVKHHGRIFKLMGDGLLAEFGSVVDAVECATVLQREMAKRNEEVSEDRRIQVRIGINLGDVIVEGDDRHGDGVNIAARLQELAEPGGLAVSGTAYDHLQGKVGTALEFAGEQQLKNIARPMRVYRARFERSVTVDKPTLALPEKPSIAVLPFVNMSDDPQQEYFSDGVAEEIITALSRFRYLFVIARNSSFTYKGRAVDVKQVGRELGVRYVLEGSVRKSGNRVRITGQLIDAGTGAHLWADRFEGGIEDIFDLQDQVTASVVGAIVPKLEEAEIERAKRKPTDSLDAYDYFLRGIARVQRWTREANDEALRMFYRAIELDPNFATAYGMAARCYAQRKTNGWFTDRAREVAEATRLARSAVELGRDDAVALSFGGLTLAYVAGDLDDGAAFAERALTLNSNLAIAWDVSGWMNICLGDPDTGIKNVALAMRLNPLDPRISFWQFHTALAHFVAGRYAEAASWAARSLRDQPDYLPPIRILAASNALAGRLDEAQKAVARLRQLDPSLRISNLEDVLPPLRRAEDRARYVDGLRKAGLPE